MVSVVLYIAKIIYFNSTSSIEVLLKYIEKPLRTVFTCSF